jgi:hypothetical protein
LARSDIKAEGVMTDEEFLIAAVLALLWLPLIVAPMMIDYVDALRAAVLP